MNIKLSLIFVLVPYFLYAQKIDLVGKILKDGHPLESTKISIVGVNSDFTTSSGEFSLTIPATFNLKAGDKVLCYIEEKGKSAVEYSVFIPNNPLLNPIIINLQTGAQEELTQSNSELIFSVGDFYTEPYGEAYYKERDKLVKVRCLPKYYHEVHVSYNVNNNLLTPVDDIVKEGYRVILTNPSENKIIITDIRMLISDFQPLPDKYIVNWEPKGIKKSITVNVDLNPETRTYKSLKKEEYLELDKDESQIVLFDLKNGAPGIYTLTFEIDVLNVDGNYAKKSFPQRYKVLIPDREKNKNL